MVLIPRRHPESYYDQQPQLLNHLVRSFATQEAVLLPLEAAQRFIMLMFFDAIKQRDSVCVCMHAKPRQPG